MADSYDEHLNLGAVLSREGRIEEAIAQYRLAAALAHDPVEALIYLGIGLAQAGDSAAAIDQLTLAQRADSRTSNAFLTHALALSPKETNLDEFIAHLRNR